jgi:hypothetical protein
MRIAESMERDGEAAEHGSPQVTVG